MWVGSQRIPCALPRMRSLTLWQTTSLSQELMVLLRNVQKITSVTYARAHYGSRFVTAFLRRMFWSCVPQGQNGTMRNLLMNSQNYGFLLKKGVEEPPFALLPEWSSLCFEYRQNFGFDTEMFEPGRLPDLAVWGDSGEWTRAVKKHHLQRSFWHCANAWIL